MSDDKENSRVMPQIDRMAIAKIFAFAIVALVVAGACAAVSLYLHRYLSWDLGNSIGTVLFAACTAIAFLAALVGIAFFVLFRAQEPEGHRLFSHSRLKKLAVVFAMLLMLSNISGFATAQLYEDGFFDFILPREATWAEQLEATTADNLVLYHDAINVTPSMRVDNSNMANFAAWQAPAREKFRELLGVSYDGALQSDVKYLSTKSIGSGIQRHKINFMTYDGLEVPCYLFQHTDSAIRPGVVVIAGHGSGIAGTAGIVEDRVEKGSAEALAKAGYVTLTCENRGMGELDRLPMSQVAANAIALGRSYQGVILEDHMQAVSLLRSLPNVDPDRVAAVGVSLGGEQAMYLAAVDDRISAAVVMGWLSNYEVMLYTHAADWAVPSLLLHFDEESIGAMIAPRPVLYSNGEDEKGPGWFNTEDAQEALLEIDRSYALHGASGNVTYKEHEGAHSFDSALAIEFLNLHIGND